MVNIRSKGTLLKYLRINPPSKKWREILNSKKKNTANAINLERNRIANQIHDNINPLLVALKCQLKLLEKNTNSKIIQNELAEMNKLIDVVIFQQNELILNKGLNLIEIKDLIGAINDFLLQVRSFKIVFSTPPYKECRVTKSQLNHIYSIVLELITNIIKHENINFLRIKMNVRNNQFNFLFVHHGIGIDQACFLRLNGTLGMGIDSIKSRLSILNGKIEFRKCSNHFKIIIEIPIIYG